MENKKIVISGYYGFNNSGDEAMLFAILKALCERFGKTDITVISGNAEKTSRTFGVKAVSRFDGFSILKCLYHSDLLISGGGSLLQDVTSWKSLVYYLSIIFTGVCFKKKVFLYAQGIGPVRHRWVRWILKFVLNRVSAITVRDDESKGFLERLGVKNHIFCTADAVLSLEPASLEAGESILKRNHIPPDKKMIGISIRRWMNTPEWMERFKLYMACMNKNHEYNFVFIPMQFPEDYQTAKEFCEQFPDVYILPESYDTEELMSLIGNMDLLIGVRLHALIFAALMHIPFIGISYDPKIDNFLQSAKQSSVFSIENFDENILYKESVFSLQKSERNYDWQHIDRLRNKARETTDILQRIVYFKGER